MIRKLRQGDIDRVADIWLSGNLTAHAFIPAEYWKSNSEAVKEMLPHSEVYVYEQDGNIKVLRGFPVSTLKAFSCPKECARTG